MDLQRRKNKKDGEVDLDDKVGELSSKYLGDQAEGDLVIIIPKKNRFQPTLTPDHKKKQSWYVDGEDATYQRPSESHSQNQLGSVWLWAENDFVDRVLGQLVLVSLEFNFLRK